MANPETPIPTNDIDTGSVVEKEHVNRLSRAVNHMDTEVGNKLDISDSSVTNPREPTAHKATHATGGTDAITPVDIGAAAATHTHPVSEVTGLGTAATANTEDFATSEQGTLAGTAIQPGNPALTDGRIPLAHNHSGANITSGTVSTARLNVGTAAGTVAAGNDARFTNSSTPTAHTHPVSEVTGLGTAATANTEDFATSEQGAKADTSVQPAALTSKADKADPRFTDTRTPKAHTHPWAEITDKPAQILLLPVGAPVPAEKQIEDQLIFRYDPGEGPPDDVWPYLVELVSSSTGGTNQSSTLVLPKFDGAMVGDLVVVAVAVDTSSSPSILGFDRMGGPSWVSQGSLGAVTFGRIYQAGDLAPLVLLPGGEPRHMQASAMLIRGGAASLSSVVEGVYSSRGSGNSDTLTSTAPSVPGIQTGSLAIAFGFERTSAVSAEPTLSTGWTSAAWRPQESDQWATIAIATRSISETGPTSDCVFTYTTPQALNGTGWQIVIPKVSA